MSGNFNKNDVLRSSLLRWKVFTMFLIVFFVLGSGLAVADLGLLKRKYTNSKGSRHFIARINISGLIAQDKDREELLKSIVENEYIDAVILRIDSTGGLPTPAQKIYNYLRQISEKKPVVAVIDGYAASAAYLISLASDRIFAMETSSIGSIGVIANFFNFSEAAEKFGIMAYEFSSSNHKIGPFTKNIDEEFSNGFQEYIDSQFEVFKGLVEERRSLHGDELNLVANGKIFNGNNALKLGLIDSIGMEEDAVNWLESIGIDSSNIKDLRYKGPQQMRITDVLKDFISKRSAYILSSLIFYNQ